MRPSRRSSDIFKTLLSLDRPIESWLSSCKATSKHCLSLPALHDTQLSQIGQYDTNKEILNVPHQATTRAVFMRGAGN